MLNIMPGMAVNPDSLKDLHMRGYITLTEAAELLNTTKPTVKSLIQRGALEGFTHELDKRLMLVKRDAVEKLKDTLIRPLSIKQPTKKKS